MLDIPNFQLLVTGLVVTMGGSFHYGYSLIFVNPTVEIFEVFLNESLRNHFGWQMSSLASQFLWSTIAGFLLLGAAIGALIMSSFIDKYGRKKGLLLSAVVLAVSFPLSGLSRLAGSIELFAFGRLLCGIGAGMAMGCQAVYLTEISPIKFRGFMGMLIGCSVELGYATGGFLGLPQLLGTRELWPIMLYLEIIPTVLLMFFLLTAKESPSFLLIRGQTKLALESIIYYHGKEQDTDAALDAIDQEVQMQKSQLGIWQIWRDRPIRNATILAMLLNTAVSFSGIMAISFFGVFLLKEMGLSTDVAGYANAAASTTSFFAAIASTFLIEKIGRRTLVMFSLVGLGVIDTLMMTLLIVYNQTHAQFLGYFFGLLMATFLFLYGCGVGSISWFLGSELAPQHARSSVQSLAISTQYLTGFICPIIYFPLAGQTGPYSFIVFIVPVLLTAVYFYYYLPETKSRKIGDIMIDLGANENTVPVEMSLLAPVVE